MGISDASASATDPAGAKVFGQSYRGEATLFAVVVVVMEGVSSLTLKEPVTERRHWLTELLSELSSCTELKRNVL